ncbi:arginine deiminase-related protein [Aquimarina sp. ERC-38]|uniref:dimethylarginine dimethylaminohydrolase family protein n=1 Tax=Aquimarina sp. ERC-38 TaxID=2949996 RepID=UPI0022455B2F|nr:arginine deiminase-related protein [Aquimarina sp. ERC-38]UZO79224.1 arginine deiminase-related protein [Aquimarina sp. ERC-38]
MNTIPIHITNETSRLRSVVLGIATSNGPVPRVEDAYDPKSIEHINKGTYPSEKNMVQELDAVASVLEKYDVKVYRPEVIKNCNQIFTRDIALVVEDYFIKTNILPDRENEIKAINHVVSQITPEKVINVEDQNIHFEGGDIIMYQNYIFIGTYKGADYSDCIVARTNMKGVQFFKDFFPNKKVIEFDLQKSMQDPKDNALHLDCCFQPVGKEYAIIHKEGFKDVRDYEFLVKLFGNEKLFHITKEEMYYMNSNIFSIAEDVVISEKGFTRLNRWLRSLQITVEEVPYAEIAKQEGLLRCSTLPLFRDY